MINAKTTHGSGAHWWFGVFCVRTHGESHDDCAWRGRAARQRQKGFAWASLFKLYPLFVMQ